MGVDDADTREMPDQAGITRRDALKKGALVGGAVMWATPVMQAIGVGAAHAQQGTPPVQCPGSARGVVATLTGPQGQTILQVGPIGTYPPGGCVADVDAALGTHTFLDADAVCTGAYTGAGGRCCVFAEIAAATLNVDVSGLLGTFLNPLLVPQGITASVTGVNDPVADVIRADACCGGAGNTFSSTLTDVEVTVTGLSAQPTTVTVAQSPAPNTNVVNLNLLGVGSAVVTANWQQGNTVRALNIVVTVLGYTLTIILAEASCS